MLYPTSIYMCRALEMAIFRKLPHSFYVNVIFVISGSFWHCNKPKTPCTWEHARMSCLFAFTSLFITHSFRWEGGILAFLQKCAGILNVFFPSHSSQIKIGIKKKNVQQTRYVLMHDRNTPLHWIYIQRRFYRFDPFIFRMCSCECVCRCACSTFQWLEPNPKLKRVPHIQTEQQWFYVNASTLSSDHQ